MIHLFPRLETPDKVPLNGVLHKTPTFCQNANRQKCAQHYRQIVDSPGVHVCPYGYSTLVTELNGAPLIYSGLRIAGFHNRKKLNRRRTSEYLPKLPLSVIRDSVTNLACAASGPLTATSASSNSSSETALTTPDTGSFINSTIHEIRKLNAQVKRQSEEALHELGKPSGGKSEFIKYRLHNSLATSMLISTRLDFYDVHANPHLLSFQHKRLIPIYSRFEKAKHCLQSHAHEKGLRIILDGTSYSPVYAYDIIDLLPFVLLENAIKFSPNDSDITVSFEDEHDGLQITVTSFGPLLLPQEESMIYNRGYRGRYAQEVQQGTGMGLAFAKLICDLNGLVIQAASDDSRVFTLSGIPYSNFVVNLLGRTSS